MTTLYLECNMGAAGDMLVAALYELRTEAQKAEFLHTMRALGLPHVEIEPQAVTTCGLAATHMAVSVHGHEEDEAPAGHDHAHVHAHTHAHTALTDIAALLEGLALPPQVREAAQQVYARIAKAESLVHGVPVAEIHFHEVGALDAVADVAAVCLLLHLLRPAAVVASPIATGSGTVQCAHGTLPVPAPATAALLRGVPVWAGTEKGELCTPTGAALLGHFVQQFGPMPVMTVEKIGYGAGRKQFATANVVRAFWGEAAAVPCLQTEKASALSAAPQAVAQTGAAPNETLCALSCNLDDATAEEIGCAMQRLLEAGARDVFTQPIGMKKCRPGTMLTVLCHPQSADALAALLLQHTPTLGVRRTECTRYALCRAMETVQTPYGAIRLKTAEGYGARKAKPEYDDVAAAAAAYGVPFAAVRAAALAAQDAQAGTEQG